MRSWWICWAGAEATEWVESRLVRGGVELVVSLCGWSAGEASMGSKRKPERVRSKAL